MSEREIEMENLLRSARAIAQRNGGGTHWRRFDAAIAKLGIGSVTARVYVVLESDKEEGDDGKFTDSDLQNLRHLEKPMPGDVIYQGRLLKRTEQGWRELTEEERNALPNIDLNKPIPQTVCTNYVYRDGEFIKDGN